MWYSKGRDCRPSAVMPLADVEVKMSEDDEADPLKFTVSCPPIRLTLRAADAIELAVWVSSLQECASAWKRRVEESSLCHQRA